MATVLTPPPDGAAGTGIPVVNDNPFPGLRPFREEEEHLFFGREQQVDAMVDKLSAGRFLAVVGASGSGKSSLVNCGLRPALRLGLLSRAGNAWRMAQFRPGSRPIRAMAEALGQEGLLFGPAAPGGLSLPDMVETSLQMSRAGLQDVFEQARLDPGVNLLVVVDQFEELFRYRQFGNDGVDGTGRMSAAEEAVAFVNLLLAAGEQREVPIYIVLTMRSDFLGDCTQFPGLAEAINAGQYLVPRLTRDERRAAIRGPVAVGGGRISSVLLNQLVNDVGDNPDQLSILQHALNRTWARWRLDAPAAGEAGPIDLPHYEAIGTMARALDEHAERAFRELGTERLRQVCEKVFRALTDKATDPRGVRRPTTLSTLCAVCEASPQELSEVIEVFRKPSRSFLMPPAGEALRPGTVIDISHESLMRVWQRLNRWADAEALSVQTYRRLSDTADLHAAGKASLWRDPDLAQARQWLERESVNAAWASRYGRSFDQALAFLRDSEQARDREEAVSRKRLEQEALAHERELAQARELAEEQRRRADEQAEARERQKRLNRMLAGLLGLALVAVAVAVWAQVRASRLAAEREQLVREGQKAGDELATLKQKIEQLTTALATKQEAPRGTVAGETAAQEVANATLDVLRTAAKDTGATPQTARVVAQAEANLRAKPAEVAAVVAGAVAAAPTPVAASPNPPIGGAAGGRKPASLPAVVAAAGPTPVGAAPPAAAAGPATALPGSAGVQGEGTLQLTRWGLASGGCLKGAVAVSGTAEFWLEKQPGGQLVARSKFQGTDGKGFKVRSEGQSKPQTAYGGDGVFEIETRAQWDGPDNRSFKSVGLEKLYISDGTPKRAVMVSSRTLCSS